MRYRYGRTVYRQRGVLGAKRCLSSLFRLKGKSKAFRSVRTRPVLLFADSFCGQRKLPMRRTKKQDNGFTLLESVVVLGIMMVMMSFAIFKSTNIMPNYKADGA